MAEEVKEVTLKVEEARQQDINRGIARFDIEQVGKLGLETGDVIGIFGSRETGAINWPGYPEDAGRSVIRIDGSIRRNAGVGIDDKVTIKKIKTAAASRLYLPLPKRCKSTGLQVRAYQESQGESETRERTGNGNIHVASLPQVIWMYPVVLFTIYI